MVTSRRSAGTPSAAASSPAKSWGSSMALCASGTSLVMTSTKVSGPILSVFPPPPSSSTAKRPEGPSNERQHGGTPSCAGGSVGFSPVALYLLYPLMNEEIVPSGQGFSFGGAASSSTALRFTTIASDRNATASTSTHLHSTPLHAAIWLPTAHCVCNAQRSQRRIPMPAEQLLALARAPHHRSSMVDPTKQHRGNPGPWRRRKTSCGEPSLVLHG
mmetsp:Transcript_86243/g.247470  ORF Transcript_86243/g.247470 Transcript_86243/m.247470 type:complete len:216 (+) Transcript_86243:1031-1678(+)